MHTIKFFEIKEYSHSLLARLNALLAQLSSTAAPMTPAALQALIAAPDSHLYALAAMPEGQTTLAVLPPPTLAVLQLPTAPTSLPCARLPPISPPPGARHG